jgi:hypothetical protein
MKKSLFTLLFLVSFYIGNAQTYKFKATAFSVSQLKKSGEWTAWSKSQRPRMMFRVLFTA